MTQEDKELLFRDLCARLPYGIKGRALGGRVDTIDILHHKEYPWVRTSSGLSCHIGTGQFKPYLRPMSSMTEEEVKEYHNLCYEEEREEFKFGEWTERIYYHDTIDSIDYLNSINIDYRGLIGKGLALEAPKGMYDLDNK